MAAGTNPLASLLALPSKLPAGSESKVLTPYSCTWLLLTAFFTALNCSPTVSVLRSDASAFSIHRTENSSPKHEPTSFPSTKSPPLLLSPGQYHPHEDSSGFAAVTALALGAFKSLLKIEPDSHASK